MVGLVGVEAKLRAQLQRCSREREPRESSAKSQAKFKRESREPSSRESQERAICDWRVVFQQSNLALPPGGLSNPIVRMGRSPAHVQACWAGTFR